MKLHLKTINITTPFYTRILINFEGDLIHRLDLLLFTVTGSLPVICLLMLVVQKYGF